MSQRKFEGRGGGGAPKHFFDRNGRWQRCSGPKDYVLIYYIIFLLYDSIWDAVFKNEPSEICGAQSN